MQVVILCGGLGTRLREETEFIPKPMVQIGDRPILWHIMKNFSCFGINEFVVALGYKGNLIKEYFYHYDVMNADITVTLSSPSQISVHESHDESDWRVTLADTGLRTLKGGRLKRVEKYLEGDTFMMTYGDGVANVDITALLKFHASHGRLATVTGINPLGRYGEIKVDGDQVLAFAEKPDRFDDLISGGFFVFNRAIFDYLSDAEDCDLEFGPLETVARDGQMMVYRHSGFWACMDTQRDREYLNEVWDAGAPPWKIW